MAGLSIILNPRERGIDNNIRITVLNKSAGRPTKAAIPYTKPND